MPILCILKRRPFVQIRAFFRSWLLIADWTRSDALFTQSALIFSSVPMDTASKSPCLTDSVIEVELTLCKTVFPRTVFQLPNIVLAKLDFNWKRPVSFVLPVFSWPAHVNWTIKESCMVSFHALFVTLLISSPPNALRAAIFNENKSKFTYIYNFESAD